MVIKIEVETEIGKVFGLDQEAEKDWEGDEDTYKDSESSGELSECLGTFFLGELFQKDSVFASVSLFWNRETHLLIDADDHV